MTAKKTSTGRRYPSQTLQPGKGRSDPISVDIPSQHVADLDYPPRSFSSLPGQLLSGPLTASGPNPGLSLTQTGFLPKGPQFEPNSGLPGLPGLGPNPQSLAAKGLLDEHLLPRGDDSRSDPFATDEQSEPALEPIDRDTLLQALVKRHGEALGPAFGPAAQPSALVALRDPAQSTSPDRRSRPSLLK